jgi:TRAP-type uncharacterized transport system fused permease subunit
VARFLALLMALYHLINVVYPLQCSDLTQNTHLAFGLTLIFVSNLAKKSNHKIMKTAWFIALVAGLVGTAWVQFNYERLIQSTWMGTTADIVVSIMMIIVIFEAVRSRFGFILPACTLFCILYAILGCYLPAPFNSYKIEPLARLPHMLYTSLAV